MSDAVANRYASALFDVARERGTMDTVEDQLRLVNQVVLDNEDLKRMLDHPQIGREDKKAVITQVFQEDINEEVLNLLKILIDRRRETILVEMQHEYTALVNEYKGIVDMTVTTASPLNKAEEDKIAEAFSKNSSKKFRVHAKVDPKVIGGALVRIGNRLYDGTLQGKLSRFHQELKAGR